MNGSAHLVLGSAGLIAVYVAVAVLLMSMYLWARQRWWIKVATVAVTGAFFWVSFYSVAGVLGWPSSDELPERFELVSAMIVEPNPAAQSAGAIYLWLTTASEAGRTETRPFEPERQNPGAPATSAPRAYRLPYTAAAASEVYEAQIKKVQGVRQIGVSNRRPMKPGEHAPQVEFFFHERPEPILPPKTSSPGAGSG